MAAERLSRVSQEVVCPNCKTPISIRRLDHAGEGYFGGYTRYLDGGPTARYWCPGCRTSTQKMDWKGSGVHCTDDDDDDWYDDGRLRLLGFM